MADNFTIIGQRRTSKPGPNGQLQDIFQVDFVTKPNNVASTVDVPDTQYNPETVLQLVTQAAANIEAIHTL